MHPSSHYTATRDEYARVREYLWSEGWGERDIRDAMAVIELNPQLSPWGVAQMLTHVRNVYATPEGQIM